MPLNVIFACNHLSSFCFNSQDCSSISTRASRERTQALFRELQKVLSLNKNQNQGVWGHKINHEINLQLTIAYRLLYFRTEVLLTHLY